MIPSVVDTERFFRLTRHMREFLHVMPMMVDQLVAFSAEDIKSRRDKLEIEWERITKEVDELQETLKTAVSHKEFVRQALDDVLLVQQLQKGTLVRVICTTCQGSGLKATDTTGGQLSRKSAFETIGNTPAKIASVKTVDEKDRCPTCKGKKYQVLERYIG